MGLSTEAALNKDKRTGLAPLQHRHFATIAAILLDARSALFLRGEEDPNSALNEYFAERLAETNPRFDRERFLKAAGND